MDIKIVSGFCWKALLKHCSGIVGARRVPVAFPRKAVALLLHNAGSHQRVLPTSTVQPMLNWIQKLSVGY